MLVPTCHPNIDSCDANGRLIAAAPDLLDALQDLVARDVAEARECGFTDDEMSWLCLQLDDARSWVVLSEWNEFIWPGPDLRHLTGADNSSIAYGMLPPRQGGLLRKSALRVQPLDMADVTSGRH